jgi:winged helix-turn-helix protein
MATRELDPRKVEEIADKAIGYLSGAGVAALVYLGDRLGLYSALRESGPSTSAELAARARLHERWVREWLHGQASAGLVRYADHAVGESRFSSPWMRANLVPVILAGLDDVTPKLDAGARIADVGCGSGKALLEMARAYPRSEFHGLRRTYGRQEAG